MSIDERESPRKAIRNWLLRTAREGPARTDEDEERDGYSLHEPRSPRCRSLQQDSLNAGANKHSGRTDVKSPQSPKGSDVVRLSNGNEHDKRLADRLNLQAPFRTFGNDADQGDMGVDGGLRCRKRRRSLSSELSYLKPAVSLRPSGHRNHRHHAPRESCGARRKIGYSQSHPSSDSTLSQTSSVTVTSPEKPVKTYRRRSRHKTKEDRYDLKQPRTDRKGKKRDEKGNKKKKKKKSRRKEKPAAAVMHSFSAPNVTSNRLTMRPSTTLGLFGKGRASSPIRRRGLPDLAFSEMTFLNTRRQKAGDQVKATHNTKRRKTDKRVDTEAEISRYFTSKTISGHEKAHDRNGRIERFLGSNATEFEAQRCADKLPSPHLSTLPPIDLPGRPFLGFGSRGEDLISPVKEHTFEEHAKRRAITPKIQSSSGRSTSYFSWSESAASSARRRSDIFEHATTESGRTPNKPQLALEPLVSPQLVHESLAGHQVNQNEHTQRSHTIDVAISLLDDPQAHITHDSQSQELQFNSVGETTIEEIKQLCSTYSDPKAEVTEEVKHSPPPSDQVQKTVITDPGDANNERQANLSSMKEATRPMRPLDSFDAEFEGLLRSCRPYLEETSHSGNGECNTSSHTTPMKSKASTALAQRQSVSGDAQLQAPSEHTLVCPPLRNQYIGYMDTKGSLPQSSIEEAGKAGSRLMDLENSSIRKSTYDTGHSDWPYPDQQFPEHSYHSVMSSADSNHAWHGYDAIYERQIQAPAQEYSARYNGRPLAAQNSAWPTEQPVTELVQGFEKHGSKSYDERYNFDQPDDFQELERNGLLYQQYQETSYPGMEDSHFDEAGLALFQEFLEPTDVDLDRMPYTSPLMDMEILEEQPHAWEHLDASTVATFRTPSRADSGFQATPSIDRSLSRRNPESTGGDGHRFPELIRARADTSNSGTPMEGFWKPHKLY